MFTFAQTTRKLQEILEQLTGNRVLFQRKAQDKYRNMDAYQKLLKTNKPGEINPSFPRSSKSQTTWFVGLTCNLNIDAKDAAEI